MSGAREQGPVDWHRVERERQPVVAAVDSKVRLRACVIAFLVLVGVVFGRVVQLELTQGAAFRQAAGEPVVRERRVPAARGRIITSDGTVLAEDRQAACVAVRYRWLEEPPDAGWLRARARERLPREARRNAGRVAEAERQVCQQRQRMHERLAELCGVSTEEWKGRAAGIQTRVERIAESVNRRQRAAFERRRREGSGRTLADRWFGPAEEKPPERIIVREAMDYRGEADLHVMAEDVPLPVVEEIESRPEQWPGVRIVRRARRDYPAGSLAAHVVGYLGPVDDGGPRDHGGLRSVVATNDETLRPRRSVALQDDAGYAPDERRGRAGLERQYERQLRGRPGRRIERADRSGRVASSEWAERPLAGADLALTIDARLQATAETLLDEALARRELTGAKPARAGAAAVVMDVDSGAILAAASAPRFDPGAMGGASGDRAAAILADPGEPLFDRTIQMAIVPGSLFKVVTAVALVESGSVEPDRAFYCRGYLERPNALRCQIYREHERGHGEVTLADALAVSCNVYFFHHAGQMGPGPLVDWAGRLGFGRRTGVDLPGEAAGCVPTPETIQTLEHHAWKIGDSRRVAIGQGSVAVTPVQMARLMAAVANGGRLVVPHVVATETSGAIKGSGVFVSGKPIGMGSSAGNKDSRPLYGHASTLAAVRRGLQAAVVLPEGTAHATVFDETVEVAGKTGTAETGGGRADHAWFAGYAPVERPRVAVVVVVTYAGDGGEVAGPVARRIVLRARQLGLLEQFSTQETQRAQGTRPRVGRGGR